MTSDPEAKASVKEHGTMHLMVRNPTEDIEKERRSLKPPYLRRSPIPLANFTLDPASTVEDDSNPQATESQDSDSRAPHSHPTAESDLERSPHVSTRPSDKIVCSCQVKDFSLDDPSTHQRPQRVALHHATDHWRPTMERHRPRTAREYASVHKERVKRANRINKPTRGKQGCDSQIRSSGNDTGKRHWTKSNPWADLMPKAYFSGTDRTALAQESLHEALAETIKTPKADTEAPVQAAPVEEGSDSELHGPVTKASSDRPPNLRGGKLVPTRLLDSEHSIIAMHKASPESAKPFDGKFTPPVKRSYGRKRGKGISFDDDKGG